MPITDISCYDLQEHELSCSLSRGEFLFVICNRLGAFTNSMSSMAAKQADDIELAIQEENMNLRQTVTISPELFEKVRKSSSILLVYDTDLTQLYLTPKTNSNNDLRKRFANPTPLGFMG
jgi:hypothetical protein